MPVGDVLRHRGDRGDRVAFIERLVRAMMFRDRSRKFIGPSPTNASSDVISGKSARGHDGPDTGRASAALVSIERIRAWACGLRLILPQSIPAGPRIGGEHGAADDFVDAVGTDRAGADDLQVGSLYSPSVDSSVASAHLFRSLRPDASGTHFGVCHAVSARPQSPPYNECI